MPKYTLEMSEAERDILRELAKAEDRSLASMMRVVFKRGLHVSKPTVDPAVTSTVVSTVGPAVDPAVGLPTSSGDQPATAKTPDPPLPGVIRDPDPDQKKERKKRKKENGLCPPDVSERVIGKLNELTGTKYRPSAEGTRRLIGARLRDGYLEPDLIRVVEQQVDEWLGTKWEKYLRPETLFNASKFESYAGQIPSRQRGLFKNRSSDKHNEELYPGVWGKDAE